jgi:hypothetical protein
VSGTRAKEYIARCDAPADAANMVVDYLSSDVETIKVNTAERPPPEESAEGLAVLIESFKGLGAGGLGQRRHISRGGILHADVRATRPCGRPARQGGPVEAGFGAGLACYATDQAFEVARAWVA